MKRLRTQLHKILFPNQDKLIETLLQVKQRQDGKIEELLNKAEELEKAPKPTLADLMRDNLKLITVDFIHQEKGVPEYFMNLPDTADGKAKRDMYTSQLAQIYQMEVWRVMIENLINTQGNYTLRGAVTDMDIIAGRFQIGGISLIEEEVKKGYQDYMERSKPKDDFDPTDHSTEGIPYSEDQNDESN